MIVLVSAIDVRVATQKLLKNGNDMAKIYPLCQFPKNAVLPMLGIAHTYEEACIKTEALGGNVIFKKRRMYVISKVKEDQLPSSLIGNVNLP